jgi:hypothetical protein
MKKYIIETPHTDEECLQLLDQMIASGYLHHFSWGCEAGVHCGWAMIEAENDDQARLAVPPMIRGQARIVQLNSFTDEDVARLHASE